MANEDFFSQTETLQPTSASWVAPVAFWSVGILLGCIFFAIAIRTIRRFFRRPELLGTSKNDLKKKWDQIEDMARRGDGMSLKLAIMEADTLLDHTLKSMGFAGTTMGERLKVAVYRYPRVRRAWQGHIIRNQLAHEATYHLSPSVARQALASFRYALCELGII